MRDLPWICVLGGGNGAFATASDLKLKGCKVNLCEVPEMRENVEPVMVAGGICAYTAHHYHYSNGSCPIGYSSRVLGVFERILQTCDSSERR